LVATWRRVLHSSDEPGELSQWQCHNDSTINIVVAITIIKPHSAGTGTAFATFVCSRAW